MQDTQNRLRKFEDLIAFQTSIAERWLDKGKRAEEPFAKFFFYFSGFNAIYFICAVMDSLKNESGERANETQQIKHLLQKFNDIAANKILHSLSDQVNYFVQRSPIQRMDRRNAKNLAIGDDKDGKRWQKELKDGTSHVDRLIALGEILYLVRCNLVHGSKAESGDDKEIIKNSILPLEIILAEALSLRYNAHV